MVMVGLLPISQSSSQSSNDSDNVVRDSDFLKDFRRLEFLVVIPFEEDGNNITRELRRFGGIVKQLWPAPAPCRLRVKY